MENTLSGSRATTPEESAEHDRLAAEEVAKIAAARAGAPLIDTSAAKGGKNAKADSPGAGNAG